MSEKETLGQRAIRLVFSVVQTICFMFAFFFSFAVALGLFYWAVTDFQEIFFLEASAILFVLVLLLAILYTYFEKRIQQLRPEREVTLVSLKENVKDFGYILLSMVGLFAFVYITNKYFFLFPETVSVNLALEIFKTVIQTNGFLIGLSGIVFAQMFWAINHQQNTIQVEMLKTPKDDLDDLDDIHKKFVNALDKKRGRMAMVMFVVIGCFLVSIALSLSGMARTELYENEVPTFTDVTTPLLIMILGIVAFVISIATSKMSLEEEVRKSKKRSLEA